MMEPPTVTSPPQQDPEQITRERYSTEHTSPSPSLLRWVCTAQDTLPAPYDGTNRPGPIVALELKKLRTAAQRRRHSYIRKRMNWSLDRICKPTQPVVPRGYVSRPWPAPDRKTFVKVLTILTRAKRSAVLDKHVPRLLGVESQCNLRIQVGLPSTAPKYRTLYLWAREFHAARAEIDAMEKKIRALTGALFDCGVLYEIDQKRISVMWRDGEWAPFFQGLEAARLRIPDYSDEVWEQERFHEMGNVATIFKHIPSLASPSAFAGGVLETLTTQVYRVQFSLRPSSGDPCVRPFAM